MIDLNGIALRLFVLFALWFVGLIVWHFDEWR